MSRQPKNMPQVAGQVVIQAKELLGDRGGEARDRSPERSYCVSNCTFVLVKKVN
jgi:hypothetical protein